MVKSKNLFAKAINFLSSNKSIVVVVVVYSLMVLSVLNWGIPSQSHPFTYHMDEWHQMQSVRAVFKYGTPNVEGAAHGPLLQFFLAGVYLEVLTLLSLVHPLSISNSLSDLSTQTGVFQALRINTLLFGLGSIVLIVAIVKKHFKFPLFFSVGFFAFSPIFLVLSGYFKYDIALLFWILLSIFLMLQYAAKPTMRNYVFAGISSGLAVATKISGLPLLLGYAAAYFLFSRNVRKDKKIFISGILVSLVIFLLMGIPDVVFHVGKGNGYSEFLYDNFIRAPSNYSNFSIGIPYLQFLFLGEMPALFGKSLFLIFVTSLFFLIKAISQKFIKSKVELKKIYFILLSFSFFILSLLSLRGGAGGNRLLVLLPFFILIPLFTINYIVIKQKRIFLLILSVFLLVQLLESVSWLSVKWFEDPRDTSSVWIMNNISKGTTIGLEDIPIYQEIPNLLLKEFYLKKYDEKQTTFYKYAVVNVQTKNMPSVVVIVDDQQEKKYLKTSPKTELIARLSKEGYLPVARFYPNLTYFKYFGDQRDFYLIGLDATPSVITVFEKNSKS